MLNPNHVQNYHLSEELQPCIECSGLGHGECTCVPGRAATCACADDVTKTPVDRCVCAKEGGEGDLLCECK